MRTLNFLLLGAEEGAYSWYFTVHVHVNVYSMLSLKILIKLNHTLLTFSPPDYKKGCACVKHDLQVLYSVCTYTSKWLHPCSIGTLSLPHPSIQGGNVKAHYKPLSPWESKHWCKGEPGRWASHPAPVICRTCTCPSLHLHWSPC